MANGAPPMISQRRVQFVAAQSLVTAAALGFALLLLLMSPQPYYDEPVDDPPKCGRAPIETLWKGSRPAADFSAKCADLARARLNGGGALLLGSVVSVVTLVGRQRSREAFREMWA